MTDRLTATEALAEVLSAVPFTQYLRPNGRTRPIFIMRPEAVARKADLILQAGLKLEAEILRNQEVSLTVTGKNTDLAFEIVSNGIDVPAAVDRLILSFDIEAGLSTDKALG